MAIRKYKCNNPACTNQYFEADDFTVEECPTCKKKNFVPAGSAGHGTLGKVKNFFVSPRFKIARIIGIVLILLLLLLRLCSGPKAGVISGPKDFKFSFPAADSFSYFLKISYQVTKDGNSLTQSVPNGELGKYIGYYKMTDRNGAPIVLSNDYRIYPCDPSYQIIWKDNLAFPLKNLGVLFEVLDKHKVDPSKCKCSILPTISDVTALPGCSLEVKVDDPEPSCSRKILVSINGQGGPFQAVPFVFPWSGETYHVDAWIKTDRDTTPQAYIRNNLDLKVCLPPPTQAHCNKINTDLITLGNNYGIDVTNGNAARSFNGHVQTYQVPSLELYLDGSRCSDLTDLDAKMGTSGCQFVILPSSIVQDSYCRIVKFEFKAKQPCL